MDTVVLLFLVSTVLWIARAIVGYSQAVKSINDHPGVRTVFSIRGFSGSLLPRIPYITGARRLVPSYFAKSRYDLCKEFGSDIISYVSALPTPSASLVVADVAAAKEILSSRARFPKPVRNYRLLTFFGNNIVASEGEEWKRFRKICGPSFSEPNNRLVWDETVSIMNDLFQNVWGTQKEIVYDHTLELTMPLALFVIGAAGFGRRMSWNEEFSPADLKKGQLSLKDTLHRVSEGILVKVFVPNWAISLRKSFRDTMYGYKELERYMHEIIASRRNADKKVDRHDLLSSLLDANDNSSEGGSGLTDQELLANIFIFLIAGHESTAHTLCFALALLALYQDEQELVLESIKKALPDGRDPTYQDLPALAHVEAVMNETLRWYPPAVTVPKLSAEDTTLTTINAAGEKVTVPVPKGTQVNVFLIAMHFDPKYWKDPYRFNPSRFLEEDWPRDAFLPFSGGARSCIGRRFSELETIVAITTILQKYKVTVKQEPQYAGETLAQTQERIMASKQLLTLKPNRVPLVFTRRD